MQERIDIVQTPVTLRQLQAFVAVADHGSYLGAGAELGLQASTVWNHIDRLKDRLGIVLVAGSRGQEATSLTAEGRALLGPARELVASVEAIEALVALARAGEAGEWRIGAYPNHVSKFLARAIGRFSEMHPAIRISVPRVLEDRRLEGGKTLFDELDRHSLDFVIAPDRTGRDGEKHLLYSWRLVAIDFDHRLKQTAGRPVSIKSLAAHPLLSSPRNYSSREHVERVAARSDLVLDIAVESQNVDALMALGECGLGIPIIPSDAVPEGAYKVHPILDAKSPIGGAFALWTAERRGKLQPAPEDVEGVESTHDLLAVPRADFIDLIRQEAQTCFGRPRR